MEISVRSDKVPNPFNIPMESSSTVSELLEQICARIEVDIEFKDALLIKRGFPPRPVQLVMEQTLSEAGFTVREKLIVSVDEEMLTRLKAEKEANMDPLEVERQKLLDEKRSMKASNVGCDPS